MDILNRQFGLVIAYLLPGFIAMAGIAPFAPIVSRWLHADQTASLGAPLYALLAATAAGMIVSCVRWFVVDQILVLTGLPAPTFNASALQEHPVAFNYVVESHYRYYQFYANTLVAIIWAYSIHRWLKMSANLSPGTDLGVLLLCVVLFAGSRNTLGKYRNRSRQLVGQVAFRYLDGGIMTNGIDHNLENGGTSEKPPVPPRSDAKPEAPAKPQPPRGGKQTK